MVSRNIDKVQGLLALFKREIPVFAEWGGGGVEGAGGENFVILNARLSVRNLGDRASGHFLDTAFSRSRRLNIMEISSSTSGSRCWISQNFSKCLNFYDISQKFSRVSPSK